MTTQPGESDFLKRTHGIEISVDAGDTAVRLRIEGHDTAILVFDEAMDVRDVLDEAAAVACRNIAPVDE